MLVSIVILYQFKQTNIFMVINNRCSVKTIGIRFYNIIIFLKKYYMEIYNINICFICIRRFFIT